MKAIITVIDDDGKVIDENREILPKVEDFWDKTTRVARFEFEIYAVDEAKKDKCNYPKDDVHYRFCERCELAYICKFNET